MSDNEQSVSAVSIAATPVQFLERSQRSKRGNRMQMLLNNELDDEDVYKELYGGFAEVENDELYSSEEEDIDEVDSDFDENDDVEREAEKDPENPNGDDDFETKKKKITLPGEKIKKVTITSDTKPKPARGKSQALSRKADDSYDPSDLPASRKSKRSATIEKAEELTRKEELREAMRRKFRQIKKGPVIKYTQEQLLEEAKFTEEINLESLDQYLKMEEERKRAKPSTKPISGSRIIFHSTTEVDDKTHERFARNYVTLAEYDKVVLSRT